jgi:hypothetical protein
MKRVRLEVRFVEARREPRRWYQGVEGDVKMQRLVQSSKGFRRIQRIN